MSKPYLVVSDIHAHKWSQFATTLPSGVNSRLQIIRDELLRAASTLIEAGGHIMVVAGDLFHVRGSIDPEVFNPINETFAQIIDMGIDVFAIPGNHDLASKDTSELSNAFQSLEKLRCHKDGHLFEFFVITKPEVHKLGDHEIFFIPWQRDKAALREVILGMHSNIEIVEANMDLVMHVGIDGMLDGVPASGLTAAEVASWGFKRAFAGDYHNYREAEDGTVISIGATTHQQWGDIGTKAGFLLVYPDRVEHFASHAPSFIEITSETAVEELPLIVDGNYVRVRGMKLTDAELIEFRKSLEEMGARGVTFQVTREVVSARGSATLAKATTLDESVDQFIDTMGFEDPAFTDNVKLAAGEVLKHIRSIGA